MIRALDKMVDCMTEVTLNPGERVVAISHCNAPDTASSLKEKVKRTGLFKDVFVLDTDGVSSPAWRAGIGKCHRGKAVDI